MEKREKALKILHESGLWAELERIGEPHLVGSVRMDLMAVNDIDVDIINTGMSLEKLYCLTAFVLEKFRPKWYEAKEECSDEQKTVWFHGFMAEIDGEIWNFDLWFFEREVIEKAEAFCDDITERVSADPALRRAIIGIKEELNERGLYRWDLYHSMDVYAAVLEQGARTTEEFLRIKEGK